MTDSDTTGEPQDPHERIEDEMQEDMDWPRYFVSGEGVEKENFAPSYYRVEGPNGPASFMNPGGDPVPSTMYDFAMEAQADHFRQCRREETPWEDNEQQERDADE